MTQSTFSWEEPRASRSPSPDSEAEWMTSVATWRSNIFDLLLDSRLGMSSGKTSPASCRRDEDGTLVPSSGRWANSGMGSPTESWTLSMCEWTDTLVPSHNGGGVSSLLDVLETGDVQPQYYLSARAAAGIPRRAERRGKKMPEFLKEALREVARRG